MLTVIIKNSGEPSVIQLTYENIWRELKDIEGAELLVEDRWIGSYLNSVKNRYVCFLESDCVVSSGYFSSQLGLFKKNPYFRKLSMMTSATAIKVWSNKIYGYSVGNNFTDGVIPNRVKKSKAVYPVQVGYVPGAVVRLNMLHKALTTVEEKDSLEKDLVKFSTTLSLSFWRQGDGNPVYINPNSTYATTEEYVNDVGKFNPDVNGLADMFAKESI